MRGDINISTSGVRSSLKSSAWSSVLPRLLCAPSKLSMQVTTAVRAGKSAAMSGAESAAHSRGTCSTASAGAWRPSSASQLASSCRSSSRHVTSGADLRCRYIAANFLRNVQFSNLSTKVCCEVSEVKYFYTHINIFCTNLTTRVMPCCLVLLLASWVVAAWVQHTWSTE